MTEEARKHEARAQENTEPEAVMLTDDELGMAAGGTSNDEAEEDNSDSSDPFASGGGGFINPPEFYDKIIIS